MRVLLLEESATVESTIASALTAAGCEVARCADEVDGGPCRAVRSGAPCPLDRHVDVAVVVREHGAPDLLFEMGAVCAERHRVPVVRVGSKHPDAAGAVRSAAAAGLDRLEARYAAAVRAALGADATSVEATRSATCVRVAVHAAAESAAPATPRRRTALAERARQAIRGFDPFVPVVDIAVSTVDPDSEWLVDDGDAAFRGWGG